MKSALGASLRVYDEAVVLPQAHRSTESGGFKGVAMKLSGTEGELSAEVFSPNWFSGVSAVAVPSNIAEPLLKDPRKRAAALKAIVQAIPSEMEGADVQVGPSLDGDEHDRDTCDWHAGFDSPGCCVGLYSAQQSRSPDATVQGMHRIHNTYFLVCKAGGGLAAQTFHSRLVAALGQGLSLDEALKQGNSPGQQGLRRVSLAAQRNRARILEMAARAIGYHAIDTISDNAARAGSQNRMAVTTLNVQTNVLRENPAGGWHYAAGCVDSSTSQGLLASSNPHEGFVVFTDSMAGYKINLRNPAYNCLPFSSMRLNNNRDAVMTAADKHKKALNGNSAAHPDAAWVRERFGWKAKALGVDIEPPPLWGTYSSEEFITAWGRELGIASCRVMRLQPEVVAIAAVEPAKLRAAARHVQRNNMQGLAIS